MICGESACEYFKEFFESAMRDALPRHRTWGLERIVISSLKMLDGTLEETSHSCSRDPIKFIRWKN